MRINNRIIICFRVLVFSNLTLVYTKNTETKKICYHYISKNHDDKNVITYIFGSIESKKYLFIGYGCKEFDCKIITFIYNNRNREISSSEIYYYSKMDLEEDESKSIFFSIDLKNIFLSEKLRLSFSQMAYQLNMSLNPYQDSEAIIEELLNKNEINVIEKILELCKDKIKKRFELFNEYRIHAFNVDDTLLGIRYITNQYLDVTGEDFDKFVSGRTQIQLFKIEEFVKCTELPQNLVLRQFIEKSNKLIINPQDSGKKAWNEELFLTNLKLSVGSGGIRSINTPKSYICKNDEIIIKYDFSSMFPTVMCNFSLFSRHLSQDFRNLYKSIRDERIKAKNEGNKEKSDFLKTVLNSAIGLMNSDWSYMYDPVMFCCVRIQAMYITLILLDKLISLCKEIIQVNVDGIFILTNKKQKQSLDIIINDFQKKYNMIIETEIFFKMFQYSVNDYLAIKDNGEEISKGLFSYSEYSKSLRPKVVIDCIKANLLHSISIKTFIDNAKSNPKDFLLSTNVSNLFCVKHGNKMVRNSVRYYYSKSRDSYYLTRVKDDKISKVDNLSGVTIVDDINYDIDIDTINLNAYYGLINKVIIQFKQLCLFS